VVTDLARVPYAEVRIGIGEPIGVGVRRVGLAQFDRAIAGLAGPDLGEGVHTVRKALKRLRALLALVRVPLGKAETRRADVALRDTGRRLAEARDAGVLVETLDGLGADPEGMGVLRSELIAERDLAFMRGVGDPGIRAVVIGVLEEARDDWAGEPRGAAFAGMPDAAIEEGLRRTYRRGRRRMAGALDEGSEVDFHEWRKAVKALRYQLETLSTAWPEVVGAMAGTADELGEILGTEHDLAVLGATIEERHPACRDALLERVTLARRSLQAASRSLGERVFAEEPTAFVQRIACYWASHRLATLPAVARPRR
jgi:CHAD domain-containing protein